MKFEWLGNRVLSAVEESLNETAQKAGKNTEADAKRIMIGKVATTTPGGLKDQFSIDTLKDGTVLVWCQGPKKWRKPYHASFVEMGTYKDEAQPFMRPAIKRNNRPTQNMFKVELEKMLRKTK